MVRIGSRKWTADHIGQLLVLMMQALLPQAPPFY
jgi:hypothetical protein